MNLEPIEQLVTERLILIPYTIEIGESIINANFRIIKKMGLERGNGWPDEDVLETIPRIINNLSKVPYPTGFESWMVIKKDTKEIIGDIGFKGFNQEEKNIDLGYGIISSERKKGYAAEAANALIYWAFSTKIVNEITARCSTDNTSSIHLLKKLDFKKIKEDKEMMFWSLNKNAAT